jgi:GTP pyrophosphokinase
MFRPVLTEGAVSDGAAAEGAESPSSVVSAPPPSAPAKATLDGLLEAVARHTPEAAGDNSPEQLLRRTLSEIEGAQSAHAPGLAAALDLGIAAATKLAELRLEPDALAATLLVAAAPQARIESPELASALGQNVQALAEGASRLGRVHWDRLEEERAETLRKMFLAMARDVRVVLISLAVRQEQLVRLSPDDPEARLLAQETLAVHAPLANRLGIWQFKWQLEDTAFRILEPAAHAELSQALAETRTRREAFIERAVQQLRSKLSEEQIHADVSGRPKHVYSIHRKMQRKLVSFEQIYDVSALRVICDRLQDCYAILGIVHSMWTPVPGQFDDYIAMPKGNGYQSLHTGVVGPEGRVLEVQIRTRDMHRFAEFGVAAHWAYKEGKRVDAPGEDKFMRLRQLLGQLLDWERELVDPHQLVDALHTDIFQDQVFVFTPQGDVIDLPQGATPVDFAYRVHTEVGHRCRGARVNDQIVPLDHQRQTGDRVEILTQKLARPSRDWLNPALGYLKTAAARSKVRHWFREQGRPEAIHAGRELVMKELGRLELARVSLEQLASELGHESVEELFAAVGYGDRRPAVVTSAALSIEKRATHSAEETASEPAPLRLPTPRPVAPARGSGLMIHRRNCSQLRRNREPERVVEVEWGALADEKHNVVVECTITDRTGVLGDLLKLVANQGAYISSIQAQSTRRGDTTLRLSLECRDAAHVAHVLERVAHHPEVIALRRVGR